jgi:sucrose phosphorylase
MWRTILGEIYRREVAASIAPQVEQLLQRRAPDGVGTETPELSELDTWLITYPDQFREPGRAPLAVLGSFLDEYTTPWLNGVHVLPFYPWTSDDGFAVTDYFSVDPSYGDWSDVAALSEGRRLMVDAVINHMSAASGWFQRFLSGDPEFAGFFREADPSADLSATMRPRTTPLLTEFASAAGPRWVWTTFSADQVDLDYRNPRVVLRVLEVLLEYVDRGASVIRLDAIGLIWKEEGTSSIHLPQTHLIIQFLRACLDVAAPGTIIVTETNVPHAENISYFGDGSRPEAQLVYQFSLAPLVLDALRVGDATELARWGRGLEAPVHGASFLNFLASHDGVGLRPAEGLIPPERIGALADLSRAAEGGIGERALPDGSIVPYEVNSTWFDLVHVGYDEPEAVRRHLAAHAVMLALAGVPLIYIHSLFGSPNDREGFARTGRPRSLNRRRFDDPASLGEAITDRRTRAGQVLAGIREMVEVRAGHRAFHPLSPQRILEAPRELFVVERIGPDRRALVVVNLAAHPVDYSLPDGVWAVLAGPEPEGGSVQMPPWTSCWLASR